MKKLLFILLLVITNIATAQIPKPQKGTYVNDFAHVLTKEEIVNLNKSIFEIEKASGVQLAIVLVNKIPAQYDIQDFSLLIGRKWHVGNQKRGLVYVAAIKQRKQRIEVARNLDSIFTSAKCAAILDGIKPSFKNKNYAEGLQFLTDQIGAEFAAPEPEIAAQPAPVPIKPSSSNLKKQNTNAILESLACLGGLLVVLAAIVGSFSSGSKSGASYNTSAHRGSGYGQGNYGGHNHSSGIGSFIAGAATGYAVSRLQDDLSNNNNPYIGDQNNNTSYSDNSSSGNDNSSSNWGNWGSSDSSSSSSSDSSSSYDSGYSDSGSSSSDSSGATSDW